VVYNQSIFKDAVTYHREEVVERGSTGEDEGTYLEERCKTGRISVADGGIFSLSDPRLRRFLPKETVKTFHQASSLAATPKRKSSRRNPTAHNLCNFGNDGRKNMVVTVTSCRRLKMKHARCADFSTPIGNPR
jgi:hypothetical protein